MRRTQLAQGIVVDLLLFGMGLALHFVYGRTCDGADMFLIGLSVFIAIWLFAWVMEPKGKR
jgi:hypothetical protein